ncbi:hypothetical protein D3C87_2027520 [compost metagenome]
MSVAATGVTDEPCAERGRWRNESNAGQPEPEEKTAVAARAELALPARHHAVERLAYT